MLTISSPCAQHKLLDSIQLYTFKNVNSADHQHDNDNKHEDRCNAGNLIHAFTLSLHTTLAALSSAAALKPAWALASWHKRVIRLAPVTPLQQKLVCLNQGCVPGNAPSTPLYTIVGQHNVLYKGSKFMQPVVQPAHYSPQPPPPPRTQLCCNMCHSCSSKFMQPAGTACNSTG
jgi:hypothetical protein